MKNKQLLLLSVLCLCMFVSVPANAQVPIPLGANHPELHWNQFETPHFVIIFPDGLDSTAEAAAPIAEEVYRVVTTNLQTPLPSKTKIYLSDNDELKNAFAATDDHIFVWMRGILDDLPYSLRASGTSKWLRSVLTHEFTHIVIAHATKDWTDIFLPTGGVPRWFNEGMARFMEPDGWTTDLDMVLRISTVYDGLELYSSDYLAGSLTYEAGQSLVRLIAVEFGDTALVKILQYRGALGIYSFTEAVAAVTHRSLGQLVEHWHERLLVYYATQYGQKEEVHDYGRDISHGLDIISAARRQPNGNMIAVVAKSSKDAPTGIYLFRTDTTEPDLLSDLVGLTPDLAWTGDGKHLIISRVRLGRHDDIVYDLFSLDIATKEMKRLTSDGRFEQPDVSHSGDTIVAIHAVGSGSDLVLLKANGDTIRSLTHFDDATTEVYWPRWSPDDKRIAFSLFSKSGKRDIAIVELATDKITLVTDDSINDRYPVWAPNGRSLVFVSHQNGIPNIYRIPFASGGTSAASGRSEIVPISDVATNIIAWDWPLDRDSILVTAFDSKNTVHLYWYSAFRTVSNSPKIELGPKYWSWRGVHWPLVTRTPDLIPYTKKTETTSYNSLMHIAPMFVLPFIGSDRDKVGNEGTQYGLIALAADPMAKHIFTALADFGGESKRFSYDLIYQNNQLGFGLMFERGNKLYFDGVIDDKSYYQLEDNLGLGLQFGFPASDNLEEAHLLFFTGVSRRLTPWNDGDFVNTDPLHRPKELLIREASIKYLYNSRALLTSFTFSHADKGFGSDLSYSLYRAYLNWSVPMTEDRSISFSLAGTLVARTGEEVPQEPLGFSPYDNFQGGYNLLSLQSSDRLRGIRRYLYGNKLVIGTAEIHEPDFLLQQIVPLLGAFRPHLVEFFDIGTVWYSDAPPNNPNVIITPLGKTEWLKSAGLELRTEAFGISIGGGVGWELVRGARADWFFRARGNL
ncbi:MAG: M48 family metalloprotease [Candidatus Kapaibacterium sp.]|jgi:hypothetical protein